MIKKNEQKTPLLVNCSFETEIFSYFWDIPNHTNAKASMPWLHVVQSVLLLFDEASTPMGTHMPLLIRIVSCVGCFLYY